MLLAGCLTSQQPTSVSQGHVCSENCTCFHTGTEVARQTFYLTRSQYTDTGPTSPSANPVTPGAWQGSYSSTNVDVTGSAGPVPGSTGPVPGSTGPVPGSTGPVTGSTGPVPGSPGPVTGSTGPGEKNHGESGNRTRVCRSKSGSLNH